MDSETPILENIVKNAHSTKIIEQAISSNFAIVLCMSQIYMYSVCCIILSHDILFLTQLQALKLARVRKWIMEFWLIEIICDKINLLFSLYNDYFSVQLNKHKSIRNIYVIINNVIFSSDGVQLYMQYCCVQCVQ